MSVLIPIIAVLNGLVAYHACVILMGWLERRRAEARLNSPGTPRFNDSPIINFTMPIWKALAPVIRAINSVISAKAPVRRQFGGGISRMQNLYQRLSIRAGLDGRLDMDEFIAFWIVVFLVGPALGLMIGSCLPAILGALYPPYWLYERVVVRKNGIIKELPDVVDMLALLVGAGLTLFSALERICAKKKRSYLTDEIAQMLKLVELGASRPDGLKFLSERCCVGEVTALVNLILQSTLLGSSVSPVLRSQASYLRRERFSCAERAGVAAAQKLLIPLIFCIMPATFIIIFGPVIVKLME